MAGFNYFTRFAVVSWGNGLIIWFKRTWPCFSRCRLLLHRCLSLSLSHIPRWACPSSMGTTRTWSFYWWFLQAWLAMSGLDHPVSSWWICPKGGNLLIHLRFHSHCRGCGNADGSLREGTCDWHQQAGGQRTNWHQLLQHFNGIRPRHFTLIGRFKLG